MISLAAPIEPRLLAYDSLHAAHTRRELRVFDIQFDVGGELAGVTVWIETRDFHLADCRQDRLGT